MATLTVDRSNKKEPIPNSKYVGSNFTLPVKGLINYNLELGDEFTIPKNLRVKRAVINSELVEYIEVKIKNGNDKRLYPSIFTKIRKEYDENGCPTGQRAIPTGSATMRFWNATKHCKKEEAINKGMESLRGMTLKITDILFIRTTTYQDDRSLLIKVPVYRIDLIEK